MLAAAPDGFDVVEVPIFAGHDLPVGKLADAAVLLEETKANARRHLFVTGLADPLGDAAHQKAPQFGTLPTLTGSLCNWKGNPR
ncbi:hypothetical protein [Ensifer canadensis]